MNSSGVYRNVGPYRPAGCGPMPSIESLFTRPMLSGMPDRECDCALSSARAHRSSGGCNRRSRMIREGTKLSDLQKVYKHEPDGKKTIDGENRKKEWPKQ